MENKHGHVDKSLGKMKQGDFKKERNLLSWKQEKTGFTLIYVSAVNRTQGLVHARESLFH